MYAELSEEQTATVVDALASFYRKGHPRKT
jgi:hypothetical protein